MVNDLLGFRVNRSSVFSRREESQNKEGWLCTEARRCLCFTAQLLGCNNPSPRALSGRLCGGGAARRDGAASGSAPVWPCGRTAPPPLREPRGLRATARARQGSARLHHGETRVGSAQLYHRKPRLDSTPAALHFSAQENSTS